MDCISFESDWIKEIKSQVYLKNERLHFAEFLEIDNGHIVQQLHVAVNTQHILQAAYSKTFLVKRIDGAFYYEAFAECLQL